MSDKTLVIMKVFPDSVEVQDSLEKALSGLKTGELKDIKKEPLAFGLNVYRIAVALPEKEAGHMDRLEEEVKALSGVGEIEVEAVTLM